MFLVPWFFDHLLVVSFLTQLNTDYGLNKKKLRLKVNRFACYQFKQVY